MPGLFDPISIRGLTLRNRIVMSPMCQYSAGDDGRATDWHLVHYGARAAGGVGLVLVEATAVDRHGRISPNDLGLWDDGQVPGLARIAAFCRSQGAAVGVQLCHAGRKAWAGEARPVGPSPVPFRDGDPVPLPLREEDMERVVASFVAAAQRAVEAGFQVVEVHGAHGYLLHEFLSPLSNVRTDAYGGSLENRLRFPLAVLRAVRAALPGDFALFLRVSGSDYAPGGLDVAETVAIARAVARAGVDLIDCSGGGLVPVAPPTFPGYQVAFARRIREEAGVMTGAVGCITTPALAEAIVQDGAADLVFLGRELLRNPTWPLHAARRLGAEGAWPRQYLRAKT